GNRLLVDADVQGFPLQVLTGPIDALATIDWRQRWARALMDVLAAVEKEWARPKGARRAVQGTLVFLADWVPPLALLAALVNLLWKVFYLGVLPRWIDVFLPLIVLVVVLLILHILIKLLMPLRWTDIRDEFHRRLEERVRE